MDESSIASLLSLLGSWKTINSSNNININNNNNNNNINNNINNNNNNNISNNKFNKSIKKNFQLNKEQEDLTKSDNYEIGNSGKVYESTEECLEAARLLYRLLKEDDEIDRPVFHYLGKNNIAKNKLVPLLITQAFNTDLVISILRIYVNLTYQIPINIESYEIPKQTLYMLNFKESFLNKQLLKILLRILNEPMTRLALSSGTNQDYLVIELVLTLIKNILQIQDPISSVSLENEYRCHMHGKLIELLEEVGILELFLILSETIKKDKLFKSITNYSLLLLEIFTLLLKNDTPNEIWATSTSTSTSTSTLTSTSTSPLVVSSLSSTNENQENSEIVNLLKKEKKLLNQLVNNSNTSRFIGAYSSYSNIEGKKIINKTLPSLVNQSSIRPATLQSSSIFSSSLLSSRIKAIGERKRNPSSLQVKLILKNWAEQFLDGSYDNLMSIIIQEFSKDDNQILDSERINFLLLTKFFTGFSLQLLRYASAKEEEKKKNILLEKELEKGIDKRFEPQEDDDDDEDDQMVSKFTIDNIIGSLASTLSISNFQFIFGCCETYQTTKNWLSLEICVSTLREMISLLSYMSVSSVEEYVKISFEMQSSIYYDRDAYLKLIVNLMRNYQPSTFSKSMIIDLIDLAHTTIIMVERFCQKNRSIVIKSKRQSRKAKRLNDADDELKDNGSASVITNGDDLDSNKKDQEENEDDNDQQEEMNHQSSMEFDTFMGEFANYDIIRNISLVLGCYHTNGDVLNYQIIEIFKRISQDLDLEPMFYQVSLFYLFKNLLSDPLISSKDKNSKQLFQVINQILTNYFKSVESNNSLLIDIFIPRHKTDCFYINNNKFQPGFIDDDGDSNSNQDDQQQQQQQQQQQDDELEISKETGRLKRRVQDDSDDGENYLGDDNDNGMILQNVISKLEDSLDRDRLISTIQSINSKKSGPSFIQWLQDHLLVAINKRIKEKNQPKFTVYPLYYNENENYNSNKQIEQLFKFVLKFKPPVSKSDCYSIYEYKIYTSTYLTTIYETIKQALSIQESEKEKKLKEKDIKEKERFEKQSNKKSRSIKKERVVNKEEVEEEEGVANSGDDQQQQEEEVSDSGDEVESQVTVKKDKKKKKKKNKKTKRNDQDEDDNNSNDQDDNNSNDQDDNNGNDQDEYDNNGYDQGITQESEQIEEEVVAETREERKARKARRREKRAKKREKKEMKRRMKEQQDQQEQSVEEDDQAFDENQVESEQLDQKEQSMVQDGEQLMDENEQVVEDVEQVNQKEQSTKRKKRNKSRQVDEEVGDDEIEPLFPVSDQEEEQEKSKKRKSYSRKEEGSSNKNKKHKSKY